MKATNRYEDKKVGGGKRVNPKESCLLVLVASSVFGGGAERGLEARMRPTTDKPPYRAQLWLLGSFGKRVR